MGKRKKSSRKPQGPKKREALATSFKCVFCANETSVSVKIDKKAGVGSLSCKSCGQTFQHPSNQLTVPIDIYCEWVDACELVNNKSADDDDTPVAAPLARPHAGNVSAGAGLAPGEKLTEDDRNFIDDVDDDAEADFVEED